jgi:Tol biopolymer transport system component
MNKRIAALSVALILLAAVTSSASSVAARGDDDAFVLESTIAFSSTRDNPTFQPVINAAEIYLVKPDGTNPRRLTFNSDGTPSSDGDGFPDLSPDGKKIVFDSNRNRAEGEPVNTSGLFVMDADGSEQAWLIRGGSPTWAPDSKQIAFHRSASGTGLPILPFPGAATSDSDIFVANVDDLLSSSEQPRNITANPNKVDDDPDWSPDGQKIVFTSHDVDEPEPSNAVSAEIYVMNADGSGAPERLTENAEEERGPAWSPDGTRIAYACRRGSFFAICVMDADGSNQLQLTSGSGLTPTWSPDGQKLVFHRPAAGRNQLFVINADGTGLTQITDSLGVNLIANWGELRVRR